MLWWGSTSNNNNYFTYRYTNKNILRINWALATEVTNELLADRWRANRFHCTISNAKSFKILIVFFRLSIYSSISREFYVFILFAHCTWFSSFEIFFKQWILTYHINHTLNLWSQKSMHRTQILSNSKAIFYLLSGASPLNLDYLKNNNLEIADSLGIYGFRRWGRAMYLF